MDKITKAAAIERITYALTNLAMVAAYLEMDPENDWTASRTRLDDAAAEIVTTLAALRATEPVTRPPDAG